MDRQIINLSNKIVAKIEGITSQEVFLLQKTLDEGIDKIVSKLAKKTQAGVLRSSQEPPNNPDAEAALLGRVIVFSEEVFPRCRYMDEDYFYDTKHRWIWSALQSMASQGKEITLDGVIVQLSQMSRLNEAGGKRYVNSIPYGIESTKGVKGIIKDVSALGVQRKMWARLAEAAADIYTLPIDQTHSFRTEVMTDLGNMTELNEKDYHTAADISDMVMQKYQKLCDLKLESKQAFTGAPSNINAVNELTGGWQETDLIIVAARPGMGKTSLALADALHAALNGETVVFFSLEMSPLQLGIRLWGIHCGVSITKFRDAELNAFEEDDFVKFYRETFPTLPIFIFDQPGQNWKEMQDRAMKIKRQQLDLIRQKVKEVGEENLKENGTEDDFGMRVYVDYIQLMTHWDKRVVNTETIVNESSRGLKNIAKILDCPVIGLSQLSRAVESRGGSKRPQLSDLRNSGAIEQDADIVVFIYRGEYYGIMEDEEGCSLQGIAELIFAKHRNGALGTVRSFFNAECTHFTNEDERPDGYTNITNSYNSNKKQDSIFDDFEDEDDIKSVHF